ncbi:MAG TPA: hypothetical protein VJC02_00060 [Candidatus Paceibacterota bacterium]
MSSVEFNDENQQVNLYNRVQAQEEPKGLQKLIMSLGLAKTPEKANAILVGIAIVAVVLTAIIFYKMNSSGSVQNVPLEAIPVNENI